MTGHSTATRIALQQVAAHANPAWMDFALACVFACASTQQRFTSDNVDELLDAVPNSPSTHEKRALGPVFISAKRKGWIFPTNELKNSTRSSRHNAPLRVWVSRIFSREAQGQMFAEVEGRTA
jgi:hypothetical protein